MPGVPKPANKRVRRNAGGVEFREVQITAGEQPSLPERDRPWSQETLEFWESLGESELAADFTNAEWRVLMMAALVHEEVWADGRMTRIDQFDKIMSKVPFTPKDRQSLRIQALTGDELERKSDSRAGAKTSATKARYGELRAVGS